MPRRPREDRRLGSVSDLVDLDRYPIHELDSPLVAECRQALGKEGAVRLDGFLRPEAVEQMLEDAGALASLGYPNDATHNAYFDDELDESLPADHPRRILVRSAQKAVARDLLPPDFAPRAVYESEEVTRFVAAVLEKDALYRSADQL